MKNQWKVALVVILIVVGFILFQTITAPKTNNETVNSASAQDQSLTCNREADKAGVTCGGYFYEDYCSSSSDGRTEYAYKRNCNALMGDCPSLVNVYSLYCPYGCEIGACKKGLSLPSSLFFLKSADYKRFFICFLFRNLSPSPDS